LMTLCQKPDRQCGQLTPFVSLRREMLNEPSLTVGLLTLTNLR
jgi:hypothetical protein